MARFHYQSPHEVTTASAEFGTPRDAGEGYVSVELRNVIGQTTTTIYFTRAELIELLCIGVPDYLPTADQVHRFLKSNPNISAAMLAEISANK